jgi:hypothetical protein
LDSWPTKVEAIAELHARCQRNNREDRNFGEEAPAPHHDHFYFAFSAPVRQTTPPTTNYQNVKQLPARAEIARPNSAYMDVATTKLLH